MKTVRAQKKLSKEESKNQKEIFLQKSKEGKIFQNSPETTERFEENPNLTLDKNQMMKMRPTAQKEHCDFK